MPDVPNAGRLVELEYAVIEDRKVRALLRDVSSIEQQARPRAPPRSVPPVLPRLLLPLSAAGAYTALSA